MKKDRIKHKLDELKLAIGRIEALVAVRNGLIVEGVKAGMSLAEAGLAAGVSKPRAQQIVEAAKHGRTSGARPGFVRSLDDARRRQEPT